MAATAGIAYLGLKAGQNARALLSKDSVVVKPEAAARQLEADAAERAEAVAATGQTEAGAGVAVADSTGEGPVDAEDARPPKLNRFHGSVSLDPARVARDAGTINQEVIQHLVVVGLVGSDVSVTLEIQADVSEGVPERVVRTVSENCRTLKFESHGFEEA